MNAIKKDLNFFTAYKKGSPKAGKGNYTSMIVIIACFVLIVSIAYGVLFFIQRNIEKQIGLIKDELNKPEVAALQEKLNKDMRKNTLLTVYYTALESAKKNFDSSRTIDSALMNKISECTPEDIITQLITVNPQSVQISGICYNNTSPAIFAQALRKLGIFSSVTSDGFVFIEREDNFTFSINCFFGVVKTDD